VIRAKRSRGVVHIKLAAFVFATKLEVTEIIRKGFELINTHFCWFCVFFCTHLMAEQSWTVVTENHPPVQYMVDNKIVGPSTEIVLAVLNQSAMTADIKMMPWARAYNTVQENKNTLIYSMLRTTSREAMFHWIGPVAQNKGALLALHSRQDLVADSLDDAKQYIVGSIRNSYAHEFLLKQGFREDKNLFLVATLDEEINLLVNKRFDFILSDPDTIAFKLKELALVDSELDVIVWLPQLNQDLYLAANLHSNKEWVAAMKTSMDKFSETAAYKVLYERASRH
jgi:polar amino acid transport system substrate-binding protein